MKELGVPCSGFGAGTGRHAHAKRKKRQSPSLGAAVSVTSSLEPEPLRTSFRWFQRNLNLAENAGDHLLSLQRFDELAEL